MSESIGDNLDNLMAGDISEGVSEATSEEIAVRAAAAAKKMKKLRKDEGAAKHVDAKLAKILPSLSFDVLTFVAKLIDFHIPSLTILTCISIGDESIEKLCQECLKDQKIVLENALPSTVFQDKAIATKIDFWWQYIIEADKLSKTSQFSDLKSDKNFITIVSQGLANILKTFLESHKEIQFNKKELEYVLNKRGGEIFSR